MSYSVITKSAVRIDIINSVEYYKKINPDLAKQFLLRVREAKTYISISPFGFQIKYNGVRTLLLKQFPCTSIISLMMIKRKLLYLLLFMPTKIRKII